MLDFIQMKTGHPGKDTVKRMKSHAQVLEKIFTIIYQIKDKIYNEFLKLNY